MFASTASFLPSDGSLKDLARQGLARVRAARALRAERARVRFELSQYSDRELADMGMARGDIDDVVAGVRPSGLRAA